MKNTKTIPSVIAFAALVLAGLFIGNRQASTQVAAVKSRASDDATTPTAPHVTRVANRPENPAESAKPIRLNVTQELGSVNGTLIQLKRLVPILPGEEEKSMTAVEYQSRLERAIEAELMFQEARRQGVELTPQQKERLDKLESDEDTALLELNRKQGVTWSSYCAEEVEFEKQLLSAQMLQQNLILKEAGVTPSPEPEIQFRFEQARRELLGQLHADAKIIRAKLPR